MSVIADIEEARNLWRNSSLLVKGVITISVSTATSSVASISDTVFRWKGLFLQGIELYRSAVTRPIADVLYAYDIYLSPVIVDLAVIWTLTTIAMVRTIWAVPAPLSRARKTKFASMFGFPVSMILIFTIMIGFEGVVPDHILIWISIFTFIVIGIALTVKDPAFMRRYSDVLWPIPTDISFRRRMRVRYFAPVLIAIGVVAIMGGINAGLIR